VIEVFFVVYITHSKEPLITAPIPQEKVLIVQKEVNKGQFNFRLSTGLRGTCETPFEVRQCDTYGETLFTESE